MSSDFQNRVRRNLEQPTPADHPTADVLTAYAEHTLSAREEQEVVQHLSVCAECRDVVYLAGEAVEEPTTPVASLPEPRRFRWWTWALPLTAVLVVGSVVLVQGPTRMRKAPVPEPPSQSDSKRTMQSQLTAELEKKSQPEPQAAPAAPKTIRQKPLEPPAIAAKQTDQLAQVDRYEAQPSLSAGLVSNAPVAAPPPLAPSAGAQAKAKDESPAGAGLATVEATAQANSLEQGSASARAVNGTLLDRDQNTRADADKKAAAPHAFGLARAANVTRRDWIVTAQGRIQHLVSGTYINVPLDPAAHFNVVAASGVNVWVAGKNLALYHSPDDGLTWQPQSLPAQAPADITRLQATDALNLSLATSTGQSFVSHDGGKTWLPLDLQKPR